MTIRIRKRIKDNDKDKANPDYQRSTWLAHLLHKWLTQRVSACNKQLRGFHCDMHRLQGMHSLQ